MRKIGRDACDANDGESSCCNTPERQDDEPGDAHNNGYNDANNDARNDGYNEANSDAPNEEYND